MREAQFVLTNPTHFAVAMVYDPDKAGGADRAGQGPGRQGAGDEGSRARMRAFRCSNIPQLARSVYFTTREGQMIREELYAAIAAVLAFVLSLKRGEARPTPTIEVPVELRFDADGRLAS